MYRICKVPNTYTEGYHYEVQKRIWILPIWVTEEELKQYTLCGYFRPIEFKSTSDAQEYIGKQCAEAKRLKELSKRKTTVVKIVTCKET